MGRGRITQANLLEMIPQRIRNFETKEDQTVVVLYPRFSLWPFCYLTRWASKPFIRIQLDKIGSAIWLAIDGKKNVAEINKQVCEQLQQPENEDWYRRITHFFAYLHHGDLIQF